MKRMLFRAALAAGVVTALAASPSFSQTTFHKYVALGDSLTAGVEGVCLVERHQIHSFPKVVAEQLGIADFQQPLLSERALRDASTPACLGAVVAGGTITVGAVSQTGGPTNLTLPRPYDNLGIPGADTADLVDLRVSSPTGGTASLASTVILRNFPGGPFEGLNAVDEEDLLGPDFVTLWIGNNDVLGAALSGVAIEGVTLTPVDGAVPHPLGHARDARRVPPPRAGNRHPGRIGRHGPTPAGWIVQPAGDAEHGGSALSR